MSLSTIVAFTISTPGYHELAVECARRIRQFAGIDCLILTSETRENGYALKFELARLAGGRVFMFADADWWMIRHTSLDKFIGMEGAAFVPDPASAHPTFCQNDADVLGFPRGRYCNTGFFVANSADSRVIKAFDDASVLLAQKRAGLHELVQDKTEQSLLCKALHENQLPTQFLSQEWNTYLHAAQFGYISTIPGKPYALHAAGVPLHDKFAKLTKQCTAFESFA